MKSESPIVPDSDAVTGSLDTISVTYNARQLRILSGIHEDATVDLDNNLWLVLGSAPECDIILKDFGVAPYHCLIGCQSDTVSVRPLDGPVWRGTHQLLAEVSIIADYSALRVGRVWVALGQPGSEQWKRLKEECTKSGLTPNSLEADSLADDGEAQASTEEHTTAHTQVKPTDKEGMHNSTESARPRPWVQRAIKLGLVVVLTLGGLVGTWHGVSQANHALHTKGKLVETVQRMGLPELNVVRNKSGQDVLTGIVPTEDKRAELVQALAKLGIHPPSDIVTGEHLALAVQNEFRQNGFNVSTHYKPGGVVVVDGMRNGPAASAIESRILQTVKGIRQVTLSTNLNNEEVGDTAAPAQVAASNGPPKDSLQTTSKRIVAVVGGDAGYLVTGDGSRYSVGTVMEDGTEIQRIGEGTVTFLRNGKPVVIDF